MNGILIGSNKIQIVVNTCRISALNSFSCLHPSPICISVGGFKRLNEVFFVKKKILSNLYCCMQLIQRGAGDKWGDDSFFFIKLWKR